MPPAPGTPPGTGSPLPGAAVKGLLTNHVLTIVEQALWDLTGHLHQTPVWNLLGGLRDRVSAYGSTMCGDYLAVGLETPKDNGRFAGKLVAAGYQAVKPHTWMPPIAGAPNVARGIYACQAGSAVERPTTPQQQPGRIDSEKLHR